MNDNSKHKIAFRGRNKKKESEKQSQYVHFKCTVDEKKKIQALAKPLSVSEYVRKCALNKSLKIVSKTDKESLRIISKAGVNLNQMARVLNTTKDPNEIKQFREDLNQIIAELKGVHQIIKERNDR
tara:strand:- start:3265 stop:3642 length:378 start_codon:yes stop_codon:yes gene_type:complete